MLTVITAKEHEGDSDDEFALTHLLGYLDIGGVELVIAVGLKGSEK